jgi:16S rRNA (uracil1498-N3)-methyltransferase
VVHDYGKRNYYLHIAMAPPKNIDRFKWFLEKAAEIGIDEITPVLCDRSERKIVNQDNLEGVITSAVKQSISAYHPKLNDMIKFKDWFKKVDTEFRFIAYCGEAEKRELKDCYSKHSRISVLIGPEGDFTPNEVQMAKNSGFREISLGNRRYRTETAGIVACHTIALMDSL